MTCVTSNKRDKLIIGMKGFGKRKDEEGRMRKEGRERGR